MQFWRLRCPLPSTFCKLENQESQWYNSVWVWRPENQGATCVSPRVQRLGNQELDIPAQEERRARPSSFLFCLEAPNGLDDAHPHWWWWSWLSLLNQMLISRSALTDTPRLLCQLSEHPLAQSSWHLKWTITAIEFFNLIINNFSLWKVINPKTIFMQNGDTSLLNNIRSDCSFLYTFGNDNS